MNRHYPLHTQNLWAAAQLHRRTASLSDLAVAAQKLLKNVIMYCGRFLNCYDDSSSQYPHPPTAPLNERLSDESELRAANYHLPRTCTVQAEHSASFLHEQSEPHVKPGILASLYRWLPHIAPAAASPRSLLASYFSTPLYATQVLPHGNYHGTSIPAARPERPPPTWWQRIIISVLRFTRLRTPSPLPPVPLSRFISAAYATLMTTALWPVRYLTMWRTSIRNYRVNMSRRAALLRNLENAGSYTEWRDTALALDTCEGSEKWKVTPGGAFASDPISSACNLDILAARLRQFCELYASGNIADLSSALRESLVRNTVGICHPELHSYCRVGTKLLVEDYVNVVSFFLLNIAHASAHPKNSCDSEHEDCFETCFAREDSISIDDKLKFFNETRHAYGRTALMLSGGAAMGLHHLGVVRALLDQDLLPKVVSGTSAGALVASIVAIFDDSDLRTILHAEDLHNPRTNRPFTFRFFDEGLSLARRLRRLVRKGAMQDIRMLQDSLRKNYGDVTFGEAYQMTRRILNITVCPADRSSGSPLLLNYLTSPHVLIWSAASASCALPMVFAPVGLVAKDASGRLVPYQPDGVQWIDGSVSSDVPLARIGELFNVNHFIVSQTNPHIIPRGLPLFQTRLAMLLKSEFQFRYWQALQLRLVPRLISQIFPHMLQPYEGDVTIMPEVNLRDLCQLFRNPTMPAVLEFLRRGERQTFPKLDRVRLQCLIERTLDTCVDIVAKAAKDEVVLNRNGKGSLRSTETSELGTQSFSFGRVPSWLWVDTLPWGALERRRTNSYSPDGSADVGDIETLYDADHGRC